jgi:hypothetical protein
MPVASDDDGEAARQETLTDSEKEDWEELMQKSPGDLTDAEKTTKIKLSIKRRYDPPEWSLAFELASPEGRRADAIAVNTFPSRNFKVVGFEFKASRSDWLSEKNEGAKADYFVTACDEWYVVSWSGVVEENELPEGWGLLELKPNSEQLWSQVESDLTKHQQGEPDKAFWGRFIQKTVGGKSNYTQQDLREAKKRGFEEGKERGRELAEGAERRRLERKAEKWDDLQDAGIDWLHRMDDEEIRRLKQADRFLQMIREDGIYNSIMNEFEDLLNAVKKAEAPLYRLQEEALEATEGEADAE